MAGKRPTNLGDDNGDDLTVSFAEELTTRGRFVTRHRFNPRALSFNLAEEQEVDEANLVGRVRLTQRDVHVEADALDVKFTNRVGVLPSPNQSVERVTGTGNVNMVQGSDRLTCRAIDIEMLPDPSGRTRPRTAIAHGDVLAVQKDRTIRARDSLTVEFGLVEAPLAEEVGVADREASKAQGDLMGRSRVAARRVKARGDVSVLDPDQGLDVKADALNCVLNNLGEIDDADVTGTDDSPASVRLNDLTVAGREILLDVGDETARVPGQGRLTIQSMKDLDGRPVDEPVPIAITWTRSDRKSVV